MANSGAVRAEAAQGARRTTDGVLEGSRRAGDGGLAGDADVACSGLAVFNLLALCTRGVDEGSGGRAGGARRERPACASVVSG